MNSIKFGLGQHTIDAICSIFSHYPEIDEVNFREGSDIDLTIKSKTLTTTHLLKIENELEELMLPYKIDLSLFNQLSEPEIIDHIKRIGIRFYPR